MANGLFQNFKASSKNGNWGTYAEQLSLEQVNTGCMLRIADAVEIMAKDRSKLEKDLEWYKDAYNRSQIKVKALENQVTGLKAAKSRYKNQVENLKTKIYEDHIAGAVQGDHSEG